MDSSKFYSKIVEILASLASLPLSWLNQIRHIKERNFDGPLLGVGLFKSRFSFKKLTLCRMARILFLCLGTRGLSLGLNYC